MNKHILMVQGWLLHPESYTKEQLDQNYIDAFASEATCDVACEAAWVVACEASCGVSCEAVYFAERTEYWLNKCFELTGENRQEYIDAINKDNKQ